MSTRSSLPYIAGALVAASCVATAPAGASARSRSRPLTMSLTAPAGLLPAHPSFSYRVQCTAACAGEVSLRVWSVGAQGGDTLLKHLDLGPDVVSITAQRGGAVKFTHRYRGGPMRELQRIVNAGGTIELKLSARVRGANGSVVQAHSSATLHG